MRLGDVRRTASVATVLVAVALASVALGMRPAHAAPHRPSKVDLGSHVLVFDPTMSTATIQARVDAVAAKQVSNQFGRARYALLFKPGTYGTPEQPLRFQVGYYTEVAGLGRDPGDVVVNGSIDVYNQCNETDGCLALNNFWRSMSNLRIDVAGGEGCQANTEFWAVSQAAPLRRVDVHGTTSLMDYCTAGPQYASGGYIADSAFSSTVVNGSQQQFYTRDSTIGSWSNAVWNAVFSGVEGAPEQSFPSPPYTTLPTTPAKRDKPYLYVGDDGNWRVFVPAARQQSRGASWRDGSTPGRSLPLSRFHVARPGESVARINAALRQGKHLLLTPGVYDVGHTIRVTRPDTVVLGLGLATLVPTRGNVAMSVDDVRGVDVAGLTFDAGPSQSPVLLRIGSRHHARSHRPRPTAVDPIGLQDVFFRIGGPHPGRARVSLAVHANHTILDDIWAWRADHGEGVGWRRNTADTGVVVDGDDVTATGLFVEHYQKFDTIWRGERGRTVFYQNEMPYDPPNQAAWRHGHDYGYAAYKVADSVRHHEAWGLGSYIYTNVDPSLHASNAFEVPTVPGVRMHDLSTVSLNKAGTIDHVINGVGTAVTPEVQGPSTVTDYPAP